VGYEGEPAILILAKDSLPISCLRPKKGHSERSEESIFMPFYQGKVKIKIDAGEHGLLTIYLFLIYFLHGRGKHNMGGRHNQSGCQRKGQPSHGNINQFHNLVRPAGTDGSRTAEVATLRQTERSKKGNASLSSEQGTADMGGDLDCAGQAKENYGDKLCRYS
jgi:hypothetical protein